MKKLYNVDLGILEFDKNMKYVYKNKYIETNFIFFNKNLSNFIDYIHIDDIKLFN